jgi:hypothetical protein
MTKEEIDVVSGQMMQDYLASGRDFMDLPDLDSLIRGDWDVEKERRATRNEVVAEMGSVFEEKMPWDEEMNDWSGVFATPTDRQME